MLFWDGDFSKRACFEELSPQEIYKLGYAAAMSMGGKLAISYEHDPGMIQLSRELVSGVLHAGGGVADFGEQPVFVSASGIRFYGLSGGFHISKNGKQIELLGNDGSAPEEEIIKKIKMFFEGEILPGKFVQEPISLHSYKLFYFRELLNNCRNEQIDFKLLIKVENPTIKSVLLSLMKDCGCSYTLCKYDEKEIARLVKTESYNFGVYIDETGEKLMLCDNKGEYISEEKLEELRAIMVFEDNKTYVMAPDSPSVIEQLAANISGKIIKTGNKSSITRLIMSEGGLQLMLRQDPIGCVIRLADYLKTNRLTLKDAADSLPDFYMRERSFPGAKSVVDKIQTMKKTEKSPDGLRFYERGGRVVVRELKGRNELKLICEAATAEMAEEILDEYTEIITKLQNATADSPYKYIN